MQLKTMIVFAVICLTFSIVTASPKSIITNDTFDFGYVPQNAKVSHKYWVKSIGTEQLKITKVIPGCGCTKAPLQKNVIESGDSTWLEIIFSTKKFKSKVVKSPKIITNEDSKEHRVKFSAYVVTNENTDIPIQIAPFSANLSGMEPEKDASLFTITNTTENELSISIIEMPLDDITAEIPKVVPAGQSVDASIYLKNRIDLRSFHKSITIEINDKEKSRFTIPITYQSSAIQMTSTKEKDSSQ